MPPIGVVSGALDSEFLEQQRRCGNGARETERSQEYMMGTLASATGLGNDDFQGNYAMTHLLWASLLRLSLTYCIRTDVKLDVSSECTLRSWAHGGNKSE